MEGFPVGGEEFLRLLVAGVGVFGESFEDDGLDAGRDFAVELGWWRWLQCLQT